MSDESSSQSEFEMISAAEIERERIFEAIDGLKRMTLTTSESNVIHDSMTRIALLNRSFEETARRVSKSVDKLGTLSTTSSKLVDKLNEHARSFKNTQEVANVEKSIQTEATFEIVEAEDIQVNPTEVVPIDQSINGEWKQVETVNFEEFLKSLGLSAEDELVWRTGNLCLRIDGNNFVSTHRVPNRPPMNACVTPMNVKIDRDDNHTDETMIKDNKLITLYRAFSVHFIYFRVERVVENKRLTIVYNTRSHSCTRVFERVGDFIGMC